MNTNPNIARRLYEVIRCLHQVRIYLGISAGVPVDATRSLDELLRLIVPFEAESIQDALRLTPFCTKTDQQATAISVLQKKVE